MRDATTMTAPPGRLSLDLPPVPFVRVLHDGDTGILDPPPAVVLREGSTPIGRGAPGGDGICLEDIQLSRLHATLHVLRGQLRIVDQNSKNGTFVNGRRVDQGPVRDGDVIRVGASFLLVRIQPPSAIEDAGLGLRGTSPGLQAVRRTICQAAPTAATVLLIGESGSGKELCARALHEASGRSGPLLAINCSAIPESLAESQLFGHTAGAFTGAAAHPGFFRAAHGGTLFLDEVTELPATIQPKLLRVLEERAVIPVGAVAPVRCDVRLLAATNREPTEAVDKGRFRGDLYARLAEVILRLPPLRERREDILSLLLHAVGRPVPPLSGALVEALLLHPWPYNVRELLRLGSDLRIRGAGMARWELDLVQDRLVPISSTKPAAAGEDVAARPESAAPERDELERLLREARGSISDVARRLGYSRRQVYRWLEQIGINPRSFRGLDRPGKPG